MIEYVLRLSFRNEMVGNLANDEIQKRKAEFIKRRLGSVTIQLSFFPKLVRWPSKQDLAYSRKIRNLYFISCDTHPT